MSPMAPNDNQRRHDRYEFIQVIRFRTIIVEETFVIGEMYTANARNLSDKGIYFITSHKFPLNTPIELYCKMPGGEDLNIFGRVARVVPENGEFGLGIEVLDISEAEIKRLFEEAEKSDWKKVS